MVSQHPTPYPGVNEILDLLQTNVKQILQEQFVGMVLYGSLSSGDFDPDGSDIDFLVVTTTVLDEKTIAKLEDMHYSLWNTGLKWAEKLEGSYLPQAHLRCYEKTGRTYPTLNEGRFYLAPHGSDWVIQRHIIREYGIVLAGLDPKSLIDPVSPDDIRSAVTDILQEWWFPMLENPSWLKNHGSEYHAYAILTMCRALYAIQHGKIISKPAAARWAGQQLGDKWPGVIEQSLAMRAGQGNFDLFEESLELISFTMECVGPIERKS